MPSALPAIPARCALLLAIGLAVCSARADTLRKTDGTTLEGTVYRADDGWRVVDEAGNETFVPADEVAGLSVGESSDEPAPGRLDVRLESLRNSVANIDNVSIIIEKYESFLEQNKGTPAADEAQKDLQRWLDVRDSGLIKFAGEWITPDERDRRLRETFLEIADARLMIKRGDLRGASAKLQEILRANPTNVSALYLQGVLEQSGGQLGQARSLFERVDKLLPDHAPTQINLAAVNLKQNRHARALGYLEGAMLAAPGNREILDNVAEALELLPEREAQSREGDVVRQLFLAQDASLRQQMSESGLYRWGSGWVTREESEQLEKARQEVEIQLAELDAAYRRIADDMEQMDQRLEQNAAFMQRMQAERTYIDDDGRIFQRPLPPIYFEVEREQQQLQAARQQAAARLKQIPAQVDQVKAQLPRPQFMGELTPIGEDGVPVLLPSEDDALPSTQPTTQLTTDPTTIASDPE